MLELERKSSTMLAFKVRPVFSLWIEPSQFDIMQNWICLKFSLVH